MSALTNEQERRQRAAIAGAVAAAPDGELRPRLVAALEALDEALFDLRDEGRSEVALLLARKAGLPYPHRVVDDETRAVLWEGEEGKVPPPLSLDERVRFVPYRPERDDFQPEGWLLVDGLARGVLHHRYGDVWRVRIEDTGPQHDGSWEVLGYEDALETLLIKGRRLVEGTGRTT